MTTQTIPSSPSFLRKRLPAGITPASLILVAIMILAVALHMYNIDSIGDANAYYTAAVQSMLKSWSNFFFVAAEPGGSVTVDKPPLGLWIEAACAWLLGVSGFSVSLPNILAGVFGVPVLYHLVKRYMGELAGLIAALVMALTPVYVATNRNNTMDGMLVFLLLVAAWTFIKAADTGKARWLIAGGLVVGLGFNIKMMQAFLPLPAFYALYFLGSREGWLRKIVNLGIASVLLIAVSLSWAVVVDLTPADQRPFIGSSGDNTVMGLILGHNGLSRLESNRGPAGSGSGDGQAATPSGPPTGPRIDQGAQFQNGGPQGPPPEAFTACANSPLGTSCSFSLQNGNTIGGVCISPPNRDVPVCAPAVMTVQDGGLPTADPGGDAGGGTPFSRETGSPGVFRFFTQPLSKQMSWLLPFALISLALVILGARVQLPIDSPIHKSLVLWGGWLLTCVVFFSMVSGIFHAYYAIMLVPALGAVVGLGFSLLWTWGHKWNWTGILLIAAAGITIGFQWFASSQYGEWSMWMLIPGFLLASGSLLMFIRRQAAHLLILTAMLVIPAYWTVMTTASNPNINLPTAYQGVTPQAGRDGADRARQGDGQRGSRVDEELVDYLQSNTQDLEYLVAVPSSGQGAPLVLATGRPVLYMGGFSGQDEVVTASDLEGMVANGELRYVLYGGQRGGNQDIAGWLNSSCSVVQQFSRISSGNPAPAQGGPAAGDDGPQPTGPGAPGDQPLSLYLCQ